MNAHVSILPATSSARLDRMFADYVADAEASHAEFMATGERRQRDALTACNAAIVEAQRTARATLEQLGEMK